MPHGGRDGAFHVRGTQPHSTRLLVAELDAVDAAARPSEPRTEALFDRLCAGLRGLAPVRPSGSALRQVRQRLGPAPMKALFNLVSGPAATAAAAGRWRGLRVVAVDGTLLSVPDCPAKLAVFTRQRLGNGISGYPQLRLAALVAYGTRSVIGAVFGPATTGELEYAHAAGSGPPGRDAATGRPQLLRRRTAEPAGRHGRDLLVRCKTNRKLIFCEP